MTRGKLPCLLVILMLLAGCAVQSGYMKPVGPDMATAYTPSGEEAVVVFMRPSRFGGAVQSSVFDVTTEDNVLIGIVSSKTRVAYRTSPGRHLFMVIGESADFMAADLEGGKTYYVLVTPRMGVWKARFSLRPVHRDQLESNEFKNWKNACRPVEKLDTADRWAEENAASIQSKRESYYEKWKNRDVKPLLSREDGI